MKTDELFYGALALGILGALTVFTFKEVKKRNTPPEEQILGLKTQMENAYAMGDMKKYLKIQNQISLLELEVGL